MFYPLKMHWKQITAILLSVAIVSALVLVHKQADAQTKTLYWGSTGSEVSQVQTKLKNWGYYTGAVDGVYGSGTFNAVKKFQTKNGLTVDGVVGKNTWSALGINVASSSGGTTSSNQGQRTTTVTRGDVNRGDVWLLAKVVMGEAGDEPYTGQVAVAAVMLNRVSSPKFPNTLAGVVYQPLAFESVSNGQYNRDVSSDALKAAQVAMNGWDPTGGALFFWNPNKPVSKWIWSRTITGQIGGHVFAI